MIKMESIFHGVGKPAHSTIRVCRREFVFLLPELWHWVFAPFVIGVIKCLVLGKFVHVFNQVFGGFEIVNHNDGIGRNVLFDVLSAQVDWKGSTFQRTPEFFSDIVWSLLVFKGEMKQVGFHYFRLVLQRNALGRLRVIEAR